MTDLLGPILAGGIAATIAGGFAIAGRLQGERSDNTNVAAAAAVVVTLQAEIAALRLKISDLQAELITAREAIKTLTDRQEGLEDRNSRLRSRLDAIEGHS